MLDLLNCKDIYGYASVALTFAGYSPYIRSTIRGKIKPHVFSWMIWSAIAGIAFFAQDSDGAGPGAWAMGITAISCAIIAVLAFFIGDRDIKRSDWGFFLGAICSLPVWYITHNALYAIFLITLIDAFGYYPTFRKTWNRPFDENEIVYATILLSLSCHSLQFIIIH